MGFNGIQIAKLMQITWLTTVCGRCSYSILRVYKPTDNWGGSHLVDVYMAYGHPITLRKPLPDWWPCPNIGRENHPCNLTFQLLVHVRFGFGASWWKPEFSRAESPKKSAIAQRSSWNRIWTRKPHRLLQCLAAHVVQVSMIRNSNLLRRNSTKPN